MEKEFIPYELAVALKELEFDEDGLGMYSKNGSVLPLVPYTSEDKAILFSQAFKWLREKYDLHSYIDRVYDKGFYIYEYFIDKDYQEFGLKSYEEAELKCLKKLIEIVKSR